MTRTLIIESGQKPTEEQLKEVEEAKKSPINFDEDCGELSPLQPLLIGIGRAHV